MGSLCSCAHKVLFEPSQHLWQVWGLILNAILTLLPSYWGFSFALGCAVSFFGGIQPSPVDGYSAASCNLEFSQEKMSTRASTLPSSVDNKLGTVHSKIPRKELLSIFEGLSRL